MAKIKNIINPKYWWGRLERLNSPTLLVGILNVKTALEKVFVLKIKSYPEEIKIYM